MTPGACQKIRSAPQKQPSPNIASSAPRGHGGTVVAPVAAWVDLTCSGWDRPGSASVGEGSFSLRGSITRHMTAGV